MIGGTQVERPLEDLPSLCRAKAAPTMRDIIGEPPAKDMGCNPAAAGCGDSRERPALAAWRQAAQADALAGVTRRLGAAAVIRTPARLLVTCAPHDPGTTTGRTGANAADLQPPSCRRHVGRSDATAGPFHRASAFPQGRIMRRPFGGFSGLPQLPQWVVEHRRIGRRRGRPAKSLSPLRPAACGPFFWRQVAQCATSFYRFTT